jgi:hypothetical protein
MELFLWAASYEPRICCGRVSSWETFTFTWLLPVICNVSLVVFIIFKLRVKDEDACDHLVQGFTSLDPVPIATSPELKDKCQTVKIVCYGQTCLMSLISIFLIVMTFSSHFAKKALKLKEYEAQQHVSKS